MRTWTACLCVLLILTGCASDGVGDTSGMVPFGVSSTGSSSTTETQHVKYRFIQLSGNLNEKMLHVQEQGEREIDLTGNVLADVAFKFKVFYI